MNASSTDNFALPFLQPGQALKTITHNEALQRLDTGLYLSCSDMAADALPDNPVAGETLILSNTSTEEHAGDIAVFQDGVWLWFTPKAGWSVKPYHISDLTHQPPQISASRLPARPVFSPITARATASPSTEPQIQIQPALFFKPIILGMRN